MKTRKGYLQRRGKTWHAVWFIAGRRFAKTTGQSDKRDAEKRLNEIMAPFLVEDEVRTLETVRARIEGAKSELTTFDEQRNPPLTLAKAWDAYLSAFSRPDSGAKTLRQYESHVDQFLAWIKEQHPTALLMRDVSRDLAETYAAHLTKRELSANRFNKHIRFLELMFRVLYDKARLTLNPWENIRRKRQTPQSRRELTVDELRRVCSTAKGEMRLLLAIGIYTGLRLGDATTLRWGEVDLKRGIIRRIPNKTASRNPKPIHIPIHSALAAILNELPQEGRGDYVLPETAENYLRDPSIVTNSVRTLMEANGIRVHKPGTGHGTEKRATVEVGFHSLRHTFVSMCREANAPLSVVESLVGHSNPTMTRLYSHTSELAAVSAVNLLPAVMGDDISASAPAPRLVDAEPIRALADKLTGKNWKITRDELLKVC